MNQTRNVAGTSRDQPAAGAVARRVPIAVLGLSLSGFFVVSYGICIAQLADVFSRPRGKPGVGLVRRPAIRDPLQFLPA